MSDNDKFIKEANEREEKRVSDLKDAGIDEKDVLESAKDDNGKWDAYFSQNVSRGKDDVNFALRDQWTAVERSEFTRLFIPAMTFNRVYDTIKKVAGDQRKNKPDLMVRSLNGKSSQDQINLRADMVRTISYQSQNNLVYQNAFKQALLTGYGAFEIEIDYESPRSFNKIIKYNLITDQTQTSYDPTAIKPHKGDGNFVSRRFAYTKEEFYAQNPHIINPISYADPQSLLNMQRNTKDTIVLCRYFRKEWFPLKIFKLSNGMTVTEDEWEELQKDFAMHKQLANKSLVVGDIILDEIPKIVAERHTKDYRIMGYNLIQNMILDWAEWPSKHLPIIFVDGDSHFVEGQQYTRSFIHDAKDAQKFLNYLGSECAAEFKNRRREQWVGTPDNIVGYEQLWRNPELQKGILLAKPDPKTGQMPIKQPAWEAPQSLLLHMQRASQDIKEILGFSESEELQGRDVSGKARRERKLEGSMSAYVFLDNLNQAIEQGGRVVNDLLYPVYGNDERHVVLSKQDGSSKPTMLNKKMANGEVENMLEPGEFDIEIDTGPSFAVQKSIALEFLQQTVQTNPQVFNMVADLWAANLDVQFMPQIKKRLEKLVPPQILAEEKGEPPPPPQPDPQQMMMEMEMHDRMAQIQERHRELSIREQKHELEKIELAMHAKELQEKLHTDKQKNAIDLHKADLSYTKDLARIIADLHKEKNKKVA